MRGCPAGPFHIPVQEDSCHLLEIRQEPFKGHFIHEEDAAPLSHLTHQRAGGRQPGSSKVPSWLRGAILTLQQSTRQLHLP